MYLTPPPEGFLLQLSIEAWDKNEMMVLQGREISLTISLAVWIQYTNVTDKRTDRQTDRHGTTAKTALTHSVVR